MSSLPTVAVVGVGYVGLPLACALAAATRTIAYDADAEQVARLARGVDRTSSVDRAALAQPSLTFTADAAALAEATFIIVAVPTPVDDHNIPDLSALRAASAAVGRNMPRGATVVFESTVYPGATEEECVPILERASGMRWGDGFQVGYSPERINPGDPAHGLREIVKVVAANDDETRETMARVYGAITSAGVCRVGSIRVAEAAKVIENVQRDVNIALMNELAMVFHEMGLNTAEVLRVAGTKWNFAPYRPGLVGGHCIGVDPYYFAYRAVEQGYYPQMVLAGRRINDGMGQYVAQQAVKQMIAAGKTVKGATVLVLGVAYKENVGDTRNSRVVDIVNELVSYGARVNVYDPLAPERGLPPELAGRRIADPLPSAGKYDALVIAVPHRQFLECSAARLMALLRRDRGTPVVIDVRGARPRDEFENAGALYWEL